MLRGPFRRIAPTLEPGHVIDGHPYGFNAIILASWDSFWLVPRLQKAWRKMSDEEDRLHEEYGEQMPLPMPQSWTDLRAKFEDHVYFFILTSRQALKAS